MGGVVRTVAGAVSGVATAVGSLFGGSGIGSGYSPSSYISTESHAQKIASELAQMKEKVRKSTSAKEEKLMNYLNEAIQELLNILEKINGQTYGEKRLDINITHIRTSLTKLKKESVGFIGSVMDERLILDDKELSVILKERDDKKRKENFEAFCVRVQNQALTKLQDKISSTIRKQEDLIRTHIQTRLDEVRQNAEKTRKAYEELLEIKASQDTKLAKSQIEYMYEGQIWNLLLLQLQER